MIIRVEDLKDISQAVLSVVDTNEISIINETLELVVKNNVFYMNVTNREYYVSAKVQVYDEEDFRATVDANVFLKLISQITTDVVEFNVVDNYLAISANGSYRLPLIYENDKLLELPVITINNKTSELDVDGNILLSILNYNSRQLNIGTVTNPIQKLYYIDEFGAITFTSGACVNNFNLDTDSFKLLEYSDKLLFKKK